MTRLRFSFAAAAAIFAIAWLMPASALAQSAPDPATPPDKARVEPTSVQEAGHGLAQAITRAVSEAGGDIERSQIHLVLGLATGHFAQDPLSAAAARGIAGGLMRELLVQGDRVSVFAWEMKPWAHPQVDKNPALVPSDVPEEKAKLQDLLPLTPQAGSAGGHDTEATITAISEALAGDGSAIIVLLAPTAASISAPGTKVMGANHPAYLNALKSWHRMPQVNDSGASQVLHYQVIPATGVPAERTLDCVIVAPKRFSGQPLLSGTRSGRAKGAESPATEAPAMPLASDEPQAPASEPRSGGKAAIIALLIILVLAMVGIGAWKLRPPQMLFSVCGHSFALADYKAGQEICTLVGQGYSGGQPGRTIPVEERLAPPSRLVVFVKQGRGVRVGKGAFKAVTDNQCNVAMKPLLMNREGKHRLVFTGESALDPSLPPQTVSLAVDVALAPIKKG